jgi:hypothetical protein
MSPADLARVANLVQRLAQYQDMPLPGANSQASRTALASQMVDSQRRIEFAHFIRDGNHNPRRADPHDELFDPLRAAVLHSRDGDQDNAGWLVFLATHFGKHQSDRWRLLRDVYGRLGSNPIFEWSLIRDHFTDFADWYGHAQEQLSGDGVSRRFSNHRKYESLQHVPGIFSSFREWIVGAGGQAELVRSIHRQVGQHPGDVFDELYKQMKAVRRFGRLATFDYLTMLGKLGIAPIEPASAYLRGATGPLAGARLLFGSGPNGPLAADIADDRFVALGDYLSLGMQVMEDSICNWQKSPNVYVRFRG